MKRALAMLAVLQLFAAACSESIDHGDSACDPPQCGCSEECVHGTCTPVVPLTCASDHDCDAGLHCLPVVKQPPHGCGYSQCQAPDAGR